MTPPPVSDPKDRPLEAASGGQTGGGVPRWLPLYDTALGLGGLLWLPYYLLVRRPGHPGISQRFGSYPEAVGRELAQPGAPVWIHAVSVGEVLAALPLLAALQRRCPDHRWVVSTTTPTGQTLARARAQAGGATVVYAPWDLTPCVRRALGAIRPRVFIGLETELWPNLFLRLGAAGVPIAVVNGRISQRSFPRYLAVRRWLRPALAHVRVWAMQTPADAQRILALGVDRERVHVVGNLKADITPPPLDDTRIRTLRGQLGASPEAVIWIAGSTHPGEEELALAAFRQVVVDHPAARLMLAPRHPERVAQVEQIVRRAGFTPRRRSQSDGRPWRGDDIIILDTLGELFEFYTVADLVFVGGSMVPRGGHNVLEPAQLGRPVVTGPHVGNFQSVVDLLRVAGGLFVVDNPETLARQVRRWLAHPDERRQVGERAQHAVTQQAGSTAKTVAVLMEQLESALVSHGG